MALAWSSKKSNEATLGAHGTQGNASVRFAKDGAKSAWPKACSPIAPVERPEHVEFSTEYRSSLPLFADLDRSTASFQARVSFDVAVVKPMLYARETAPGPAGSCTNPWRGCGG